MNKKYINPKTGQKYGYYNRKGEGYADVVGWAKNMEAKYYDSLKNYAKYKVVKQETTWLGFWVSTVWIGIDMGFSPKQPPLIFETMVFYNVFEHSGHDWDMERYTTEAQAIAGHKEMVKRWSNPFYVMITVFDQKTWSLRWKISLKYKKLKERLHA